ncbi:MAG: molybdopterin-dependent oxidoreductase [Alphaproteobacteria bacterium]|nr:molybdopterin-dependent oxidoreductase [Alphaproteobacteria bacterium]
MNVAKNLTRFTLNGAAAELRSPPLTRLAHGLRDELGLTGTKIGCDAGDCGACTVLLDGEQVCACLVAVGQVAGLEVTTVEGLATDGALSALQAAFQRHGAAQCGICSPGMLMAATGLLASNKQPDEGAVMDAIGGVLCRCTGYRKIIAAILDHAGSGLGETPASGEAVGARMAKLDGVAKLNGTEKFGDDSAPEDALWLRAVRSPHARARFSLGDFSGVRARYPGLVEIFTGRDVPGSNSFGVYPLGKDQPVLAIGETRYRGEAILALVGDKASIEAIGDEELPIDWHPLEPVLGIEAGLADGATLVQDAKAGNILASGHLRKGDIKAGFAEADFIAEGRWRTSFVEHAYIEPEAGWAERKGERIEIWVSTQTPYMDRDEVAHVLGIERDQVRIVPSACGGGFGGKLDLSVQPLVAIAAWKLGRPVRCAYSRPESMASSTKRHPARITARAGCTTDGKLTAFAFHGDFDTGAYASWGPTVADRVPIHATGPFVVPNVENTSVAVHTNAPPSGAFRGFGVPQAALAHEALYDELAEKCGIDPLEFRLINAIGAGQETATGQVLEASAGLGACLQALKPHWDEARKVAEAGNHRSTNGTVRGVGIGCMWYGCGNTSMSNPSTMRVGIDASGGLTLYNGAVDMGQGPNTIMVQICADALGLPASLFTTIMGDTDLTADAGKSSASRQTFVSGKAAQLAGEDLRQQILRLANVSGDALIDIAKSVITVHEGYGVRHIELSAMKANAHGDVLTGEGSFDPPTTPLDEYMQGAPYATYGFGVQMAEVEVDEALGTVKVSRILAVHDVGRAINPIQVEGQIEGGIAQGLGLALMEEFLPGVTENLHDYLIPTAGDLPPIESILIEDPEPLGPYGAKGIGEQSLIPTAPAIFGAIHHATGVRMRFAPATPHRVRAAILAARGPGGHDDA